MNATDADFTATEMNYGLDLNVSVIPYGDGSKTAFVSADIAFDRPLGPDVFSVQFKYREYTFGPYVVQTYCKYNSKLAFILLTATFKTRPVLLK